MKKIAYLLSAVGLMMGLAACETKTEPVYQDPTPGSFVLNTPVLQDQYIDLATTGTIELVTSQPDYGVSTVAQYSAQMSLTGNFDTDCYNLPSTMGTMARMNISSAAISTGVTELMGYNDNPDQYEVDFPDGYPYMKIYFRAVCQIAGVPSSLIYSNTVAYNYIKPQFLVEMPGSIYLIGSPNGWTGPTEDNLDVLKVWALTEAANAVGSKVYTGVFDIPASPMFRFYTELTGWDEGASIGTQADDNPVQFNWQDGETYDLVKGKGSFEFVDWAGGTMTIQVDLNTMKVTFWEGAVQTTTTRYIYVMGQLASGMSWQAPAPDQEAYYNNWRLADTTESGIYSGSFTVTSGYEATFRFALALDETGWDNPLQIGPYAEDNTQEQVTFTGDTFTGNYVSGKGSWHLFFPADGTIDLNVDTNNQTVTFVFTAN